MTKPRLKELIFIYLLAITCITMGLGKPIGGEDGKLAFSNLTQIVTVSYFILSGLIVLEDIYILLIFFAIVFTSFLNAFFVYDFIGKPFVLFFVIISLLQVRVTTRTVVRKFGFGQFSKFIRVCLGIALPFYFLIGLNDYLNGDIQISYGMDDKSHAAIILCFFAFLSIGFFKRFWIFFAASFYFLSLLTISRMPVIFFPFIIIALFIRIKRNSGIKSMLLLLIFLVIPAIVGIIFFLVQNSDTFLLMQRVSSKDAIGDDASTAHTLLIIKGVQLKLLSWNNFLFGVSPGAFSDILIRSSVNFKDIEAIDPQFIEFARLRKAPVHSTHIAVFCEYPIVVFILYVLFILSTSFSLLKRRLYYDLLFWIGFLAAITFYSSHNKLYFYMVVAYIVIRVNYAKKDTQKLVTNG